MIFYFTRRQFQSTHTYRWEGYWDHHSCIYYECCVLQKRGRRRNYVLKFKIIACSSWLICFDLFSWKALLTTKWFTDVIHLLISIGSIAPFKNASGIEKSRELQYMSKLYLYIHKYHKYILACPPLLMGKWCSNPYDLFI